MSTIPASRPSDIGRHEEAQSPPKVIPIQWWAALGAVICVFIAYVMIRWVTGPYFQRVPTGPTPEPGWMKASMIGWQILMPALWLMVVYLCVWRPWRRERRLTTDGLIVLAGTTVFVQDPLASYFNHWLTYNSYLVNWGSWVNDIPGWMSFGEPGRMLVEPPLFVEFAHGFAWILFAVVGSKFMTWLRRRRPTIGPAGLLVCTYAVCFLMDVVLEGCVWMPFGIFMFPGGHLPALFPDTYHRFPLSEPIFFGAWGTGLAYLRYFRNDRGETVVERGLDRIRGGVLKQSVLRLLAMVAALNVMCLVIYNIPQAVLFASRPATWPKDLQERSYMTDGICGAGTDLACPGPGIPLYRGDGRNQDSIRIGPGGKVTAPAGVTVPDAVPFSTQKHGALTGPFIRVKP